MPIVLTISAYEELLLTSTAALGSFIPPQIYNSLQ